MPSTSRNNLIDPANRFAFTNLADIAAAERRPYEDAVPFPTTSSLLEAAAATYGDAPALRFLVDADSDAPPLEWSFSTLWRQVRQAANLYRSLGLKHGEPVALFVPHIPSAHVALWGAQLAGCAFPINYLLSAEHIALLLKTTGTRIVVTLGPSGVLPINAEVRKAVDLAGCVEHVLEIDPDEAQPCPGSFQAQVHDSSGDLDWDPALDRDSLAALFHTGGTTGMPKILRHRHRNEVHTSWYAAMYYGMRRGDCILNGFPLFHVAGSFVYGLGPLAAGAALYLPTLTGMRNQAFVRRIWTLADTHRITHLGCVPTVLSALLSVPKEPGQADCVTAALSGGSALPTELAVRFEQEHGIPVRNIFGMTECSGIVSIEPLGAPRHPGSVGLRLPYSRIVAVPLDASVDEGVDTHCAPGDMGILAIRGPHVSDSYLDPKRNTGTFTPDNWLISGDLGYVAEDGYVYLTGRSKDLIIRSGHNIEPGVIEEAFLKLPQVETCAAVGEPDSYAGELPVIFVTLKPGAHASSASLLAAAISHIPERPALPKRVIILDRLPTTPVGKIYKPTLRNLAAKAKVEELLATVHAHAPLEVGCNAQSNTVEVTVRFAEPALPATMAEARAALEGLPVLVQIGPEGSDGAST
ncbi:AMP-binding protein [Massilia niastensis]|uniref:AMP-binding protein n=1 Tax=Massilia niastensis TaxID=544911 RepID=UPI00035C3B27|nr:AMP-binding protein [Massilia niastensis]